MREQKTGELQKFSQRLEAIVPPLCKICTWYIPAISQIGFPWISRMIMPTFSLLYPVGLFLEHDDAALLDPKDIPDVPNDNAYMKVNLDVEF